MTLVFTQALKYYIAILFHVAHSVHIMCYLLTKEEMQMAFGNVDGAACGCGCGKGFGSGIAVVVVIILLLIAMGIVF